MRRNQNQSRPAVASAAADSTSSPSFGAAAVTNAFAGSEVLAISGSVVRLRPYQYVHVHDKNSNVTRLLVGPLTYTRQDHEEFISSPKTYVCVPPSHYCIVENPVSRNAETGAVDTYASGQVKTRNGDKEVRFEQVPFPLYPGEVLATEVSPLPVLQPLEAFHVVALRDFNDEGVMRKPGEEWLVYGPTVFRPSVALEVRKKLTAIAVSSKEGLVLRALTDFVDRRGIARRTGDEWLYDVAGSFIPWVEEEVVRSVATSILTPTKSLHISAVRNFTDRFGIARVTGEQWLVTSQMAPTFMPTPDENVEKEVDLTVVQKGQYCVVLNPVDINGKPQLGRKELRNGVTTFFLHPAEQLLGGVRDEIVLGKDEGLVLSADAAFEDAAGKHKPGDLWMIRGPATYIPPVEVTVRGNRKAIPLDKNEGVYIRDTASGRVRAHIGSTVMLTENEELWEKELDPLVEELLTRPRFTNRRADAAPSPAAGRQRVKHRVVSVNVPHNHFIQVYDFNAKKARVVRGPEQVWLQPDEQFTVISMSGGRPKQSDLLKTLCLHCGPDYMTDSIVVETRDHARLKLDLSYNWEFDASNPKIGDLMFNVPDFVGDACKAIASRIRGAVAGEPFDAMHLHSASIIRGAVFEDASNGRLVFPSNGLVITSVDIHSVDPVDAKTSEALTKAVQLAIEITTTAQEASARHAALKLEQAAKGRLERQIIVDKAETERTQKSLLELQAINAAIEATGESTAEAKGRTAAIVIEGQTEVQLAEKRVSAETITAAAELSVYQMRRELELGHREKMYQLEIEKVRGLAAIEATKFEKIIAAVGRNTITAIASAGPEMQAKLLKGLGLQGYLVTDGSNPINLFNAARGMTNVPKA